MCTFSADTQMSSLRTLQVLIVFHLCNFYVNPTLYDYLVFFWLNFCVTGARVNTEILQPGYCSLMLFGI